MSSFSPAQGPNPTAAHSNAPTKKRRRRAPATGATEDCFACRTRKTQCDRRRPYCTQCVDMGKECSGYRTTLTWGVGVASRGKLRGKALPIANSPTAVGAPRKRPTSGVTSPSMGASARSTSRASPVAAEREARLLDSEGLGPASQPRDMRALHSQSSSTQSPSPSAMSAVPMQHGNMSPYQFPTSNPISNADGFADGLEIPYSLGQKPSDQSLSSMPLHPLQTHLINHYDDTIYSAGSTGSYSNMSDRDVSSPSEYPQSPADIPFTDPYAGSFPDPYSAHRSTPISRMSMTLAIPRSYPSGPAEDMASSISSDLSGLDQSSRSPAVSSPHGYPGTPDSIHHSDVASPNFVPDGFDYIFGPQSVRNPSVTSNPRDDAADVRSSLSTAARSRYMAATLRPSLDSTPFHHFSFRMRTLLEYYDRMVCPFLVAFDGPKNPYRMHILSLAVRDEGLQSAICALAMTNMRMRKTYELLGRDSYSQAAWRTEEARAPASQEEEQYRAASIRSLNAQLADSATANQDTVLATLLVLCLFHVCDTGFSHFQTQLAGVQKLLRMRNSKQDGVGVSQRAFINMVEMFFTWLDAMNSTVNDRETEIHGDSFDMENLSTDLGALEHLAGCEGRLFKLIAKLGRLNLLSQERPVRTDHEPAASSLARLRSSPQQEAAQVAESQSSDAAMANLDYCSIDGSGWDANPTGSAQALSLTHSTQDSALRSTTQDSRPVEAASAPDRGDLRHAFWKEWISVRARLDSWSFSDDVHTTAQQHDVANLSRAFHAAALLYTERLASPSLAPASASLQRHVAAALSYVARIPPASCMNKFLLWPLFIAGTESVRADDRALIRERIVGVTVESGFFNNMAGLGLLERMWAADDVQWSTGAAATPAIPGTSAFRWKKMMDGVQGEYIVV